MEFEFWGLLHDGGIEAIHGEVPGTVSVEVSIRYLRRQFPGEGTGFRVDLANCREFTYCEYDSTPVMDFDAIVALDPEIVSVEKGASCVVVRCVTGTLSMSFEAAAVYLDTGEEVSFDELSSAGKAYWDAWAANKPVHSAEI